MLTKEQIKNLEPGDKVLLEVDFFSSNEEKACVHIPLADRTGQVCILLAENLSLPPAKPKHDPCRKFKKGDKVRIVEWNGRVPLYLKSYLNTIHTVNFNENANGFVGIAGDIYQAAVSFLELVTPVEELNPYIITEYEDFYAVEKDGAHYSIFYKGSYHDNAKEAAETERDRLNAAYGKEQS